MKSQWKICSQISSSIKKNHFASTVSLSPTENAEIRQRLTIMNLIAIMFQRNPHKRVESHSSETSGTETFLCVKWVLKMNSFTSFTSINKDIETSTFSSWRRRFLFLFSPLKRYFMDEKYFAVELIITLLELRWYVYQFWMNWASF